MDIKDKAKELCEKLGCYHKCNDTKDCVVEDEALLLINQDKSNNFEVKSNNELVPNRNELPFVLTNEDKVSVKVKQIEEMFFDVVKAFNYARDFCAEQGGCSPGLIHEMRRKFQKRRK